MARNGERVAPKRLITLTSEGFLLDGATGETYTLNATGIIIVRALLQGQDSREIWRDVHAACEVAERDARRDTDEFLAQLRVFELVEPAQ